MIKTKLVWKTAYMRLLAAKGLRDRSRLYEELQKEGYFVIF